ncbi:MAG TPA: hypothetical protein VJU80_15615 [Solirubrobacteraceae bacterium]|nr:hypothetical protein [Solirubrobacteraceae bacterium]
MSSAVQLLDAAGRRRSPATLPDFHAGRVPGNKGQRYVADPPTVDEIIAVMHRAGHARYGNRLNGLIVVLWRAGLRINEALSLTETDLEERRGSILVRHGKNDRRRQVGMDAWGWATLGPVAVRALNAAGRPVVIRHVLEDPRRGRRLAWRLAGATPTKDPRSNNTINFSACRHDAPFKRCLHRPSDTPSIAHECEPGPGDARRWVSG